MKSAGKAQSEVLIGEYQEYQKHVIDGVGRVQRVRVSDLEEEEGAGLMKGGETCKVFPLRS